MEGLVRLHFLARVIRLLLLSPVLLLYVLCSTPVVLLLGFILMLPAPSPPVLLA